MMPDKNFEDTPEWKPGDGAEFFRAVRVEIGSDIEISRRVSKDLRNSYGEIVYCDGKFWRYNQTAWEAFKERELRLVVHGYDGANYQTPAGEPAVVKLSKSRVDSVLNEAAAMLDAPDFFSGRQPGINCASGFIRFSAAGEPRLEPHNRNHRCRHVLSGQWPCAATPDQHKNSLLAKLLRGCFLDDADAAEKVRLLGELAGVAALGWSTRLKKPKAVILKGETAENGKSQILDLFRGLLPPGAVSAIPPNRFNDERYVCGLAGKLLNASDELTSAAAIGSDAFKAAITGEPMTGRDVYRSMVEFRPVALHIFAANDLPSFRGGMDRGVLRRLAVVPFNRSIPEAERIEGIGRRIAIEEADLLLDFAVQGARRLIPRGLYAEPASSDAALKAWARGADPVQAWLQTITITGAPADRVKTREAFAAFRAWATEEGFRADGLPAVGNFTQRLMAHAPGIRNVHPQRVSVLTGLRLEAPE